MSRLSTWIKRALPSDDARHVEVRDGDECIARFDVPRQELADSLEAEIQATADESESRSLTVVAILRDGTDGSLITLSKPSKAREARAPSAFLGSVMRDNELLRGRLFELSESLSRALLDENKRLRDSNARLESRREETHAILERARSEEADRAARLEELRSIDAHRGNLLRTIREEFAPLLQQFISGNADRRTALQVASIIDAARSSDAMDDLERFTAKLPAPQAVALANLVKESMDLRQREQVAAQAAQKKANGTSKSTDDLARVAATIARGKVDEPS